MGDGKKHVVEDARIREESEGGGVSAERVGWLLAAIMCLIIPLAMGYRGLAVVGGASLAVLAWLLAREERG